MAQSGGSGGGKGRSIRLKTRRALARDTRRVVYIAANFSTEAAATASNKTSLSSVLAESVWETNT